MIKRLNFLWLINAMICILALIACNPDPDPDDDPEPETVYLLFTSDSHWNSGSPGSFNWIDKVMETGINVERMVVLGDIADGGQSITIENYWNYVQEFMDNIDEAYIETGFINNPAIYLKGNHEYFDYGGTTHGGGLGLIEAETLAFSHPAINRLSNVHSVYTTDNYILYDLGAVYSGTSSQGCLQQFTLANVNALDTWLNAAPTNRPIFIMAHHPIHSYDTRETQGYASRLVDILNARASTHQIYFLWGHNHSISDKDILYDKVHLPGSTLMILNDNSTNWINRNENKQLNFHYVSPGSFADSEYGSNRPNTASTQVRAKGMLVTVTGRNVEFTFYDRDGNTFKKEGISRHGKEANISNVMIAGVTLNTIPDPIPSSVWDAPEFNLQSLSEDQTIELYFDGDALFSNAAINVTTFMNTTITFAMAGGNDVPDNFTSGNTRNLVNNTYVYIKIVSEEGLRTNYYRVLIRDSTIPNAQSPNITVQPASHVRYTGDVIPQLSVSANITDGGELSYQWYQVVNNVASSVGGNSNTFLPDISEIGTYVYHVVVTNTNENIDGGNPVTKRTSNNAVIRILKSMNVSQISPFHLIFDSDNVLPVGSGAIVTPIEGGWGYEFTYGSSGYQGSWARIKPQFPAGASLADYDRVTLTIQAMDGDYTYKHFSLLAQAPALPGSFGSDPSGTNTAVSSNTYSYQTGTDPRTAVLNLDKAKTNSLTGAVELSFYEHSNFQNPAIPGVPTRWRITGVIFEADAQTPQITSHPASHALDEGDPIPVLSVIASVTDGGVLSYQWYEIIDGVPKIIEGETFAEFQPDISEEGAYTYQVAVTNTHPDIEGTRTITSNLATITIGDVEIPISPFQIIFTTANTTIVGTGSVSIINDGLGYEFTYGAQYQNSWVRVVPAFPGDATLADYDRVKFTVQGIQGDSAAKDFWLVAGNPLPAGDLGSGTTRTDRYLNTAVRYTGVTEPQILTLELDKVKTAAFTGSVQLSIYDHSLAAAAAEPGIPTKWRITNVIFEKD